MHRRDSFSFNGKSVSFPAARPLFNPLSRALQNAFRVAPYKPNFLAFAPARIARRTARHMPLPVQDDEIAFKILESQVHLVSLPPESRLQYLSFCSLGTNDTRGDEIMLDGKEDGVSHSGTNAVVLPCHHCLLTHILHRRLETSTACANCTFRATRLLTRARRRASHRARHRVRSRTLHGARARSATAHIIS